MEKIPIVAQKQGIYGLELAIFTEGPIKGMSVAIQVRVTGSSPRHGRRRCQSGGGHDGRQGQDKLSKMRRTYPDGRIEEGQVDAEGFPGEFHNWKMGGSHVLRRSSKEEVLMWWFWSLTSLLRCRIKVISGRWFV